jgi:hypothetical protein
MIFVSERVIVGNSRDEEGLDLRPLGVGAILNVAFDLQGTRGCRQGVEYAQVGLVDGPGNHLETYCAAVLALAGLLRNHRRAMVCCHKGQSRSMTIAMMHANVTLRRTWEEVLAVFRERTGADLPAPHPAHAEAFARVDWDLLGRLVE